MKEYENLRIKERLYTLCFVMLCVVTAILGSATGYAQSVAKLLPGLFFAVLILSAYHIKDFIKIPYLIWMILYSIGFYYSFKWAKAHYFYYRSFFIGGILVGIYGIITIRLVYKLIIEKNIPGIRWPLFIAWSVMLSGMFLSNHDAAWPLIYLFIVGGLCLTDFPKIELRLFFDSMMNGTIYGFFIIQGFATLFRAYDEVRYVGMFTNSNINSFFYMCVQAAFLGRLYKCVKTSAPRHRTILNLIGVGLLWAYALLTVGRTAILLMIVNIIITLVLVVRVYQDKLLLRFCAYLMGVLLSSLIAFPLVFASVRWIPARMHSFLVYSDFESDNKIHGWAPEWDERYVEMNELLEALIGRFNKLLQFDKLKLTDILLPAQRAYASEPGTAFSPDITLTERIRGDGSCPEFPILFPEEYGNSYKIRLAIHSTFLKHVTWKAHPAEENTGFWITERYYAPHAHNIFIQMLYLYGIPFGILFIAFSLGITGYLLFKIMHRRSSWIYVTCFLMSFSCLSFGMFELSWQAHTLGFTCMFISYYLLFKKDS